MDKSIKKPGLRKLLRESRALLDVGTAVVKSTRWADCSSTDSLPVLLIPGFGAGDSAMTLMRRYLRHRGYRAEGWGLGINMGTNARIREGLQQKIQELHQRSGQKVAIIGWSLGGVFARELGRKFPEVVAKVITLGSPFSGNPHGNTMLPVSLLLSGQRFTRQDEEAYERRAQPIGIPCVAIHSKSDGIVSWQCSLEQSHALNVNACADSSHFGMPFNQQVLELVVANLG